MVRVSVELTEALLSKAAGWDVMKRARCYLAQGQVLSSYWAAPSLRLRQVCCDSRLLKLEGVDPANASGKLEVIQATLGGEEAFVGSLSWEEIQGLLA